MLLFAAVVAFVVAGILAAADRIRWALAVICLGLILEILGKVHLG